MVGVRSDARSTGNRVSFCGLLTMISAHGQGTVFVGANEPALAGAGLPVLPGKIEAFPKLESDGEQVVMVVTTSQGGEGFA